MTEEENALAALGLQVNGFSKSIAMNSGGNDSRNVNLGMVDPRVLQKNYQDVRTVNTTTPQIDIKPIAMPPSLPNITQSVKTEEDINNLAGVDIESRLIPLPDYLKVNIDGSSLASPVGGMVGGMVDPARGQSKRSATANDSVAELISGVNRIAIALEKLYHILSLNMEYNEEDEPVILNESETTLTKTGEND